MISVLMSLALVMIVFWMLQTKLREALWKDFEPVQLEALPLLTRCFLNQLITMSPKNSLAVATQDVGLSLKSLRESFLLICTHRASLIFLGSLLAFSLSSLTLLAVFLAGSFLLLFLLKKWKSAVQILFLAACFFIVYQFSFFTTARWIFSQTESNLVFALSDGRLPAALGFLVAGFLFSFVFKVESLVVMFCSILFIAGGLPITNAIAMIGGDLLAWGLLWVLWSYKTDAFRKQYFIEILLIILLVVVVFLTALFSVKGSGLLSVRIFGGLEDKKIFFLLFWGLMEVLLTFVLMGWGHWRFGQTKSDRDQVSHFSFQKSIWVNGGWLEAQVPLRLKVAKEKWLQHQQRFASLNSKELEALPASLLQKSRAEVEALKRLIDQLGRHI